MSSVSIANCIKYYQTAEDIGAKDLQKYCAEIISSHWVCNLNTDCAQTSLQGANHLRVSVNGQCYM